MIKHHHKSNKKFNLIPTVRKLHVCTVFDHAALNFIGLSLTFKEYSSKKRFHGKNFKLQLKIN